MTDALEAIRTARAMRHLRPDPVPDELLRMLVEAGTCAPSPVNSQGWEFIVVTDPGQRAALARIVEPLPGLVERTLGSSLEDDAAVRRTARDTGHLARNLALVPAIIVVTGTLVYPPERPRPRYTYSAMYCAAQNILIAARALGLGAAFTTLHEIDEPAVRRVLGIPDDHLIGVTIPVGWPARPFGPVRRRPVEEILHVDRRGGFSGSERSSSGSTARVESGEEKPWPR